MKTFFIQSLLKSKPYRQIESMQPLENICTTEMQTIIGGGGHTQADAAALVKMLYDNVFVGDPSAPAATNNIAPAFFAALNTLALTNVGYDLLEQLCSIGANITISGKTPPRDQNGNSPSTAEYVPSTTGDGGTLYLGNIYTTTPTGSNPVFIDANNFGQIAHELYHAYVDETMANNPTALAAYNKNVRSELDAFIFEGMADSEVDEAQGLTNSNSDLLKSYVYFDHPVNYYPNNPSAQVVAFQNAWYDIFENRNFTVSNYNTLITNFIAGSYIGPQYAPDNLTATTVSGAGLTSSTIDTFYINDYSKTTYYNNTVPFIKYYAIGATAAQGPSTTGGGGSGSSGSPTTVTDSTIEDWVASYVAYEAANGDSTSGGSDATEQGDEIEISGVTGYPIYTSTGAETGGVE